jgi:hypothetical protein
VRLETLETKERSLAARSEWRRDVSLRGGHVGVVHLAIVTTQDDEWLTAGQRGRPLELALEEPRVTGTSKCGDGQDDTEN